jgi:hypothetical protein
MGVLLRLNAISRDSGIFSEWFILVTDLLDVDIFTEQIKTLKQILRRSSVT